MYKSIGIILTCLVVMAPSVVFAQVDMGLKGAGFRVGVVAPDHVDATFSLGAVADLGTVARAVAVEAYADYWSKSQSNLLNSEASIRDLAVGARGKYVIPVKSPRVKPFAGAGLGLHFVKSKAEIPSQDLGGGFVIPAMSVEASTTKLGLDLGGGVAVGVSDRASVITEVWYGVVSDISRVSLRAGVAWKLGSQRHISAPVNGAQ